MSIRARRVTAIAAATAVVIGGSAVGYRAYAQHLEYKAQVAAALLTADSDLRDVVADLESARRTAAVRVAAEYAASASDELDQFLPDLGQQQGGQARSVQAALDSVGALVALDAGSLGQWRDLRPAVADSLNAVTDESSQVVGTPGSDAAIASVDTVVDRGRAKLAAWELRLAQARAAQQTDLAAFDTYVDQMEAQVKTYASLRDDTAAQIEAMRNDNSNTYYYEPTREVFSKAMQERIAVRDGMNGVYVPDGLIAQHDRIVIALNDGIAGMSELLGALDDNQDCYGDCYLIDQPLWTDFQASSEAVTDEYSAAYNAWVAGLAGVRADIEDRPMPGRPVV